MYALVCHPFLKVCADCVMIDSSMFLQCCNILHPWTDDPSIWSPIQLHRTESVSLRLHQFWPLIHHHSSGGRRFSLSCWRENTASRHKAGYTHHAGGYHHTAGFNGYLCRTVAHLSLALSGTPYFEDVDRRSVVHHFLYRCQELLSSVSTPRIPKFRREFASCPYR